MLDHARREQDAAWLAGAYSLDSLVVQVSDDDTASSSSTAPALMALMLEALCVRDGSRVLEVGTGTGYNAAILCERLGSENVTTVDVNSVLVAAAQRRLADAGFNPTLVTADGLAGYLSDAPYDRIVATCGVLRIPRAWIDQTTLGGVIVTPLLSGIVRLDVEADGRASGRFLPTAAYFMPARTDARMTAQEVIDLASGAGTPEPTRLIADIEDDSFLFFVDVALPGIELSGLGSLALAPRLASRDGSWARVDPAPDGNVAIQGGPRRLWDQLHSLHDRWAGDLERPGRERYGVTVAPGDRQYIWLDSPDSEHRWQL